MISSQHGREFTDSHYEKIKKVYSIWICTNPPQYRENTINRYRIMEEQMVGSVAEPVKNYDLLSAVILCLDRPDGENCNGVLRMLDVLLRTETDQAEKREILQTDYGIPMTYTMEKEVSDMCNLSQGIWKRALSEGEEKGEARGIEKGITQGISTSLQNLMETLNLSLEQAMAALKVPEAERPMYKETAEPAITQKTPWTFLPGVFCIPL